MVCNLCMWYLLSTSFDRLRQHLIINQLKLIDGVENNTLSLNRKYSSTAGLQLPSNKHIFHMNQIYL